MMFYNDIVREVICSVIQHWPIYLFDVWNLLWKGVTATPTRGRWPYQSTGQIPESLDQILQGYIIINKKHDGRRIESYTWREWLELEE